MKFLPKCNIVYRGQFHRGNETFNIDAADAKEMEMYGKVEYPAFMKNNANKKTKVDEKLVEKTDEVVEKSVDEPIIVKKSGRPKKN